MCRMTHISALSATKRAPACHGAACGWDDRDPGAPSTHISVLSATKLSGGGWQCNSWRPIARLNGLNACIYVEASPRIRRGVVRLLFRRTKDGDAAFLHAGSIAAAFLHVGSIAAALLRAARALSVQKRHANERDV